MATVTLVQVQPRRATDAAIVTVRLAGGGSRAYTQLGQTDWLGGVARPPRFASSLGFEQRGFTGGALPQTGAIRFAPSRGEVKTALGDLVWKGARIIVRVGDDEKPAETYPVEFIGTVAAHSFDRGALSLTVADLSVDLAKPVLSGAFAGTGGLEGDEEATGRAKRRSWGSVFNVEGFVLDKANLVYEFGDPNRPLTSFPMVKDKGEAYSPVVVVAWQGSAAATLDALRSSVVADGGVAVAPSIACAKPWTRPAGPITADLIAEAVPGNGSRPTWIAVKIVREFAPDIVLPNENDAAAWQSNEAGIHAADLSETAATILDRLLFPVSIAWVLLGNGALYFRRLAWDAPVFELAAETVEREVVYQPLRTRRVGFQLNNRIHSDGEISAKILASVDPTYADGTPIDALRPAEAGSNVTETRTSAAFTGQGALATLSQLANGSQYLSGFGSLSSLASIAFGSNYLLEQPGGNPASLSAFKTVLGTAAAFVGQGALSTLNFLGADRVGFSNGGGNLVKNTKYDGPDWSFGPGSAYTLPAGFAPYNNGGDSEPTSWALVNGAGRDGGRGIHIDWNTQNSTKGVYLSDPAGVDNLRIMKANRSYIASFYARGRGDAIGKPMGLSYNVAPLEQVNVTNPALSASYQRYVFRLRWGTNVDTNLFYTIAGSTGAGGIDLDGFQIEEGDTPTAYAPALLPGEVRFPLLASNAVRLGSNIVRADGSTSATESLLVTALGIASGFSGQGHLATQSSVTYSTQISGLPRAISPSAFFPSGFMYASEIYQDQGAKNLNSYFPEDVLSNRTEGRTAAAFTGQTAFATLPAGTSLDNGVFGMPSRLGNYGGFLSADQMTYTGGPATVSVASLRPGEAGANITEGRTSAGIVGQGALATRNYSNLGTIGAGGIANTADTNWHTENTLETIKGTSAAFTGQGALATRSDVQDGYLGGNLANRLAPHPLNANFLGAGTVAYTDGTGVQTLRPQEAGANATEGRTAAAIYGQGTLATTDRVRLGSGGGMVDELNSYWLTTSSVVTAAGVSSGFNGQGSFATQSYLSLTNTSYFAADGRFEASSFGQSYFRADRMAYAAGSTAEDLRPGERGANITETRTASAIVGQQYLATNYPARLYGNPRFGDTYLSADAMAYTDAAGYTVQGLKPGEPNANVTENRTASAIVGQQYLATNYPGRLYGSPQHGDGYLAATAMAYAGGNTVEGLRPGEAGANITENRTASAILGQSGFATASNITRDNIFSAGFFNLNAFSLGYSVTRSDGTTTVTESLVVTQVGIAAGFYAQGALATRDQADTPQITPNATTSSAFSSGGGPSGVTNENSGQGGSISLISTGGTMRIDVCFDPRRTSGSGIMQAQLWVSRNGAEVAISRNVKCPPQTNAVPVMFFTIASFAAGDTVTFFVRYSNPGGGSWTVDSEQVAATEYKR